MNRRKIIVTIMSIAMIAFMLRLGFWQIERLEWKEKLLSKIETQINGKETSKLPDKIDKDELEDWDYRKVSVIGKYINDKEFKLPHRVLDGKDGYHIITPFEMENNRIILINRGWVDKENLSKIHRDNDEIKLSGVLKIPNTGNYFTPKNTKDTKYMVNINEIALENNFDNIVKLLLYLDKQDSYKFPVAGQVRIDIPNDHFQYMIFWFFMAFIQLVIFIIYMKQDGDVKK